MPGLEGACHKLTQLHSNLVRFTGVALGFREHVHLVDLVVEVVHRFGHEVTGCTLLCVRALLRLLDALTYAACSVPAAQSLVERSVVLVRNLFGFSTAVAVTHLADLSTSYWVQLSLGLGWLLCHEYLLRL